MINYKNIKDKAKEDYIKLKAKILECSKIQIINSSELIIFAKLLKTHIRNGNYILLKKDFIKLITMENIYLAAYEYYRENNETLETIHIPLFFYDFLKSYEMEIE